MMRHFLISLGLIAAHLTTAATANSDVKRRDVTVNIADLDLDSREGLAALDRRLARAVLKSCGTAHHLEPAQLNDMERCRRVARDHARTVRDAIVDRHVGRAGLASHASDASQLRLIRDQ